MPAFREGLKRFEGHPLVGEVRGVGLVGAIELTPDPAGKGLFDPAARIAPYMVARAKEHGVILRALPSDTVAFCPPLIITEAEIAMIMDRAEKALDETWEHVRKQKLV
jgi:4-aminobutyrate--pyruvate transaminase